MIRSHDVHVLAEGTLRVCLTESQRIITVIDLPESALGPLHLVFAVSPEAVMPQTYRTAGFFDDIGHAIGHATNDVAHAAEHAAEGTFNAASKVATTVARPAFNLARDAAASGVHLLASAPFVPEAQRKEIEAASRIMMRARLGDMNAKQFVHDVVRAAKAGAEGARRAGDALLTATHVVAHVLDTPLALAAHIPLIGGALHSLSPFQKLDSMAGAVQRGDFAQMKRIVTDDLKTMEGIASMIPGLGSGFAIGIATGLAILDGGGPLDIAIHAAYGAIPIPPGIRSVTDAVLEGVLKLAQRGSVTDVALSAARNAVPSGLPRDVFDTLAQLVIKRVPVRRVAADLVDHYVKRYAPEIPGARQVVDVASHVASPVVHVIDMAERATVPVTHAVNLAGRVVAPVVHVTDLIPPHFRLPAMAHS